MFEILPESDGPYLSVKARGTLTHGAYAALEPELERRIAEHGKISALFDITDFAGWDLHGAWDDFALGIKTINDFERIAVVGDTKWQNFAIDLADVLSPADIRFFQKSKRDLAWAWLKSAPSA